MTPKVLYTEQQKKIPSKLENKPPALILTNKRKKNTTH